MKYPSLMTRLCVCGVASRRPIECRGGRRPSAATVLFANVRGESRYRSTRPTRNRVVSAPLVGDQQWYSYQGPRVVERSAHVIFVVFCVVQLSPAAATLRRGGASSFRCPRPQCCRTGRSSRYLCAARIGAQPVKVQRVQRLHLEPLVGVLLHFAPRVKDRAREMRKVSRVMFPGRGSSCRGAGTRGLSLPIVPLHLASIIVWFFGRAARHCIGGCASRNAPRSVQMSLNQTPAARSDRPTFGWDSSA